MEAKLLADTRPPPAARPGGIRLAPAKQASAAPGVARCRANSRRGITDAIRPSYPPVQSVHRALEILRSLNHLRIATISDLYAATKLPKPTIVRMLDTLIADGYVARDNMCGGYRVTHRVRELNSGYTGIAQIIEAARVHAIDLTKRINWPVGIGVFDRDAIAVHFWTGTISPWVHSNTLLGHRPNLLTSAMGRAYMAFCSDGEREQLIARLRADDSLNSSVREADYRALLTRIRKNGYALRAPHTEPRRNTTIAMPIRHDGVVLASITVSFFTSALPKSEVEDRVIAPLRKTVAKIEDVIAFVRAEERNTSSIRTSMDEVLAGALVAP